ncbi:MAG: SLC13 family permease [bacterium]
MDSTLVLNSDMIMVLSILALTVTLFIFEVVRIDVAALSILVLLGVTELVPADNLFAGFSSNAVMSIIAVMTIGAGLDRTGVMNIIAGYILRVGGRSEPRIIPLISSTVGIISGFMQNVGAAALFLPVVSKISARAAIPLSRLLMPMGFTAILGGTLTMVGSSPVILLNDLIATSNESLPAGADTLQTFGLFSITPIGLALIASGIIYFLFIGRHLLPKEQDQVAVPGETQDYFAETYGIQGDVFELLVTVDSPLVGRTIAEAESVSDAPLIIVLKSGDDAQLSPTAEEMIWVGSILGVIAPREQAEEYCERKGLILQPGLKNFRQMVNPARAGVAEVVIAPNSKYIGHTIGEEHFRERYGMSVLAVNRADELVHGNLRDVKLSVGDTLVVHSTWKNLGAVSRNRDFVLITDLPNEEQRPQKVQHALFFFAVAMGMVMLTDYKLSVALMVGALGMVLSGVLTMDEAYRAVSWKTVFLLASLIPLGQAMEVTGTAAWIAQQSIHALGDVPDWTFQLVLAILATFFSLVMSNVGATVLLVPLAINIALVNGANPSVYALVIALSTSNAFILPTHQVSALIMGPGNYKVSDFMKVGGLMTILFLVVMLFMVNLIFT